LPIRKMFLGDYANQSIFCAVGALLCGFLAPFGVWAGYRAYKELPMKRTQALVGMIVCSVECGLIVLGIAARGIVAASH
jgi:hypothetical protein